MVRFQKDFIFQGLPVTYGLFGGNTTDVSTMWPMMDQLIAGMDTHELIYVANKGMMSGMTSAQMILEHNGYIISSSVRKTTNELKQYILDQNGYTELRAGAFKYKSRLVPRALLVETWEPKKQAITINERQIVFYSEQYWEKAKRERETAILKALEQAGFGENTVLNNHGGNRFIKKIIFDSATGKEGRAPEFSFQLDQQLLDSEEALDGYYLIRTERSSVVHVPLLLAGMPPTACWNSTGLCRIPISLRCTKACGKLKSHVPSRKAT